MYFSPYKTTNLDTVLHPFGTLRQDFVNMCGITQLMHPLLFCKINVW